MKLTRLRIFWVWMLFCGINALHAQRDHVWVFGDSAGLDFNAPGDPVPFTSGSGWHQVLHTCISDTSGRLAFQSTFTSPWSNEFKLELRAENGSLVIGNVFAWINGNNNALILPMMRSPEDYHLLTIGWKPNTTSNGPCAPYGCASFEHHQIGLSTGQAVVYQTHSVLVDTLTLTSRMTAIRGADGKDWWVIVHQDLARRFLFYKIHGDSLAFDHSVDIALNYARACNYCHTTFAMGEMLNRMPDQIGKSLRQPMFLEQSTYLAQNHPTLWDGSRATDSLSFDDLRTMSGKLVALDAPNHAAALGINCEACHLGCKQHTVQKEELPAFGPKHPSLFVHSNDATYTTAKNADNLNAICARCHTGDRPTYAAGMATWNSTEWTDAKRGSCYSQLTCVKCHNPHQAIGEQWTRSPKKDDDICLSCHQQYASADARQRHTHHRADSEGDRCMNCHMPKINEGIQDVVRTHTIFSPTNEKMLQANQPNACNLCHLDKPTRWATENLNQWYKTNISVSRSSGNATQLTQPAGLEWLTSSHDATRLVTSAAFAREGAKWGLPNLVPLLDDPILTNRQFAQQSIERLTNQDLNKEYGYWFYMTPEERKPLIDRIKQSLNRNP